MPCGTYVEALGALQDVADVAAVYGTAITVKLRAEGGVRRDALGTIIQRDLAPTLSLDAYPVERSPDKRKLEKAGLREEVEVMVYTPMKSWVDAGVIDLDEIGDTFAAIDVTRSTVILDGTEWKVADKGMPSRIGPVPLYITLGLRRT